MNRRKFIKSSCTACLSVSLVSLFADGCTPSRYVTGKMGSDGISINKKDFAARSGSGNHVSYVIVRNDALKYPLCVYRFSDNDYSALWMQCSHQGAELQVAGDILHCPAHGSEFNSRGEVKNGPASVHLRSFPISVRSEEIFIDLRRQP